MSTVYYLISDLHIGGDEQLEDVPFEEELVAFLADLADRNEDAELIINGDLFGLWELTTAEGMEKFDVLRERHPAIFEALRETGESVPITLIPGNHDYELSAYDAWVDRLAAYNVTLEQAVSLTRTVGDRVVYVEHGQQRDPNNASPDFGNPFANPPGYFVNRHVTSRAGRLSGRGKYNWLKDIQAVTPMTMIPEWAVSNYFYREMSPLLRYASLPFLLLFNLALFYVGLVALDVLGIWSVPLAVFEDVLGQFGIFGEIVSFFLTISLVIIVLLALLSVPLYLFVRDVRRTLDRFGISRRPEDPRSTAEKYEDAAREVFAADPEIAVFVYGHTHRPAVTAVDDRLVVNTGTWLKRLHPARPYLGILPDVYYASYRLNYVRIEATDEGAVAVEYHVVPKPDPRETTLLERLLTGRPTRHPDIPERSVVDAEWSVPPERRDTEPAPAED